MHLRSSSLPRLLTLFLIALGGLAPSAQAASSQAVYFEAPRDLTARSSNPADRAAALKQLESLGVEALRVNLRWYDVAPAADQSSKPAFDAADPAQYSWGAYGEVIDAAKAKGWKVLISPSSDVPKWATESGLDTVTRPKPAEYELFTTAAAKRFGGSGVIWSIWNEPNLDRFLRPQIVGGKFVGGKLYRELFLAGRSGIQSVQRKATVLFGETAPVGISRQRQRPIEFLRDALCVSSKYKFDKKRCKKLSVSGFAHHPYRSVGGIPKSRDDVTYQVLSRLTSALDRMSKAGAITRNRPIYLTEFGIQSTPDKYFGVPQQKQLEERNRAERIAYGNKRVRGFSQYLLTDDDPTIPGKQWGGFETGLRDHTGKEKPSMDGFRLVLDAKPTSKSISLWGLVRPATKSTTVVIERKISGSFRTWKRVKTKSNGSFTATDKRRSKVQYRYRWTAADGTKLTSPYVRPFKG